MSRNVTIGGRPYTLAGPEIKAGQKAPDFRLISDDMKEVRLSDSKGKVRLLSVVHSLDTPICDIQTQRFEQEASRFKELHIYTVSMDLPFALRRYCGAHNIGNLKTLSDHREASFGKDYGVLIKELRLLSRAIFIIDKTEVIRYVEYLKEVGSHPDYDRAIEALKNVLGAAHL